ncbi:hypothetical protein [uncultured Mediterranean phage]|nr:hypothetical protein [uncultured Mediterranean phage]
MKLLTFFIMALMSLPAMATNKIYVTQAGASLVFDVLQDGDGNMVGNSTTASTVSGSATNFNIDQVGNSNIITFDINGDNFVGTWSTTGNSNNIDFNCDPADSTAGCDDVSAVITFTGNSQDIDIDVGGTTSGDNADIDIVGASGTDSTVVAATIDGTSAILRLTIAGDSNNYLIDIDGNGDVAGHTLIMTQTGITADVDIVQSGTDDNSATVVTTGDSQNIDITQTSGGTVTMTTTGSTSSAVKTVNINQTGAATFNTDGTILGQTSDGLNGAGGTFDIDQTSTGTINLDANGASANISIEQTSTGTVNMDVDGATFVADIDQDNASTISLTHDGASADYVILQEGGSGDILTLTVNGASANVDIIQRD